MVSELSTGRILVQDRRSVSRSVSHASQPDGSRLGAHGWRKQGECAQINACTAGQGKVLARSSLRPRENRRENERLLGSEPQHSHGIWIWGCGDNACPVWSPTAAVTGGSGKLCGGSCWWAVVCLGSWVPRECLPSLSLWLMSLWFWLIDRLSVCMSGRPDMPRIHMQVLCCAVVQCRLALRCPWCCSGGGVEHCIISFEGGSCTKVEQADMRSVRWGGVRLCIHGDPPSPRAMTG